MWVVEVVEPLVVASWSTRQLFVQMMCLAETVAFALDPAEGFEKDICSDFLDLLLHFSLLLGLSALHRSSQYRRVLVLHRSCLVFVISDFRP